MLRGLSGKKLTKPGSFRSADGNGSAVKCSYKVRVCVCGTGGLGGRGISFTLLQGV